MEADIEREYTDLQMEFNNALTDMMSALRLGRQAEGVAMRVIACNELLTLNRKYRPGYKNTSTQKQYLRTLVDDALATIAERISYLNDCMQQAYFRQTGAVLDLPRNQVELRKDVSDTKLEKGE